MKYTLTTIFFFVSCLTHAQLTSIHNFVGSTASDWVSAVSQPFSVNTTSPGSVDSSYDNFIINTNLPAQFSNYSFAPGDIMVFRGNFRLLPGAALGQAFVTLPGGAYGFGFSFTNDVNISATDLIRIWTFDGMSTTIYDDHPPGFAWDKDAFNRTEINYVVTALRTPTGVVLSGDIYNGAILKHTLNEVLTFTPPVQPSYSMETLLMGSNFSNRPIAVPVADNITQLEWEITSVIPEPTALLSIILTGGLVIAWRTGLRAFLRKNVRNV